MHAPCTPLTRMRACCRCTQGIEGRHRRARWTTSSSLGWPVYSLLSGRQHCALVHDIKMDTNWHEFDLYSHSFFDEVRRSHEPGLCHPSLMPRSLRLASFAALSTPYRPFTCVCLTLLMRY